MRKPKPPLRERLDEMQGRLAREKEERASFERRLARGSLSYDDLLRAVREGRIRTREDAKRAWGLL